MSDSESDVNRRRFLHVEYHDLIGNRVMGELAIVENDRAVESILEVTQVVEVPNKQRRQRCVVESPHGFTASAWTDEYNGLVPIDFVLGPGEMLKRLSGPLSSWERFGSESNTGPCPYCESVGDVAAVIIPH